MIGRKAELNYLESYYQKEGNQMVVLYGRENIGKTTLIRSFCEGKKAIYYMAGQASERQQRYMLAEVVAKSCDVELKDTSYDGIFSKIRSGSSQRLVLVIDEFHHIVKKDREFMESLSRLMEKQLYPGPVLVILVSSSIGWVENGMVHAIGAYAQSIKGFLKIRELHFADVAQLLPKYGPKQAAETFAILGGIPGYIERWEKQKSVEENICNCILDSRGFLFQEAERFIGEELREFSIYNTILCAIAAGKRKLNDLYQYTGFSRAKISVYLKNLMEFEVVEKVFSFDTPGRENTQKGLYQIKNSFIDFWFKFVYPHLSERNIMAPREFYKAYIKPEFHFYMERYFVQICTESLELLNKVGKLPMKIHKVGTWIGKKGSIDIIAQDEAGRSLIGLCSWRDREMEYGQCEVLFQTMEQAKVEADYYYLFSARGFDERLKKEAAEEPRIVLVDLEKL